MHRKICTVLMVKHMVTCHEKGQAIQTKKGMGTLNSFHYCYNLSFHSSQLHFSHTLFLFFHISDDQPAPQLTVFLRADFNRGNKNEEGKNCDPWDAGISFLWQINKNNDVKFQGVTCSDGKVWGMVWSSQIVCYITG